MQTNEIPPQDLNRRMVLGLIGAVVAAPMVTPAQAAPASLQAAPALSLQVVEQPFAQAAGAISFDADYGGALMQLARHLRDDQPATVTGRTTTATFGLIMQIARDARYRVTTEATHIAANGMAGVTWRLTARTAALTA